MPALRCAGGCWHLIRVSPGLAKREFYSRSPLEGIVVTRYPRSAAQFSALGRPADRLGDPLPIRRLGAGLPVSLLAKTVTYDSSYSSVELRSTRYELQDADSGRDLGGGFCDRVGRGTKYEVRVSRWKTSAHSVRGSERRFAKRSRGRGQWKRAAFGLGVENSALVPCTSKLGWVRSLRSRF